MSKTVQEEIYDYYQEKYNNIDRIKCWMKFSLILRMGCILMIFGPATHILFGIYGFGFELPNSYIGHGFLVVFGVMFAIALEQLEKVFGSMKRKNHGETFFPLNYKWSLEYPAKNKL